MNVTKERADFEAWCKSQGVETDYWLSVPEQGYLNGRTMDYWIGWQARAALAAQGVPAGWKLAPVEPTKEMVRAGNVVTWPYPCDRAYVAMLAATPAPPQAQQAAQPHTEFVLNELRSALNAMLTFFGMDEDESSKAVFEKARQAYEYARIVMRPLEPWERQSLEDFRACLSRWHRKAVAKGYDGVESMCDTALPYGTRNLRLVEPAQAQQAAPLTDEQIEQGRHATFSTGNPFCPCDSKTMRKAVRWAERACAESWGVKLAGIGASSGGNGNV